MLVNDIMDGILLKNVRRSLENKGFPQEMITKLMRSAEIEAKQMGA